MNNKFHIPALREPTTFLLNQCFFINFERSFFASFFSKKEDKKMLDEVAAKFTKLFCEVKSSETRRARESRVSLLSVNNRDFLRSATKL